MGIKGAEKLSVDTMFPAWFLYAVVSVAFFGFTTIVDKLMLEKRLSSFSYFLSFVPPGLAFSVWVLLFFPTRVVWFPLAIAFVAGPVGAAGYFVYVLSIRREEASRVAALTSLAPAFVAVFAVLLVNEIVSAASYVGIGLMISGALLISYKRNYAKKLIPLSLVLVLFAVNLLYGLEQSISKVSLDQIAFPSFLMMFMFGRVTVALPGLAIRRLRRKFVTEIMNLGRGFTIVLASGSVGWSLGVIFFFYSASLGPIALVSAASLISPLFTLLFAILITKYLPKVLEEEIDRGTVALKLLAIVLIILGTYLITT